MVGKESIREETIESLQMTLKNIAATMRVEPGQQDDSTITLTNRISALTKLFSARKTQKTTSNLLIILLKEYSNLLFEVDAWFSSCQALHHESIACAKGCSECCRGLFDITILDAALLKIGFDRLPEDIRRMASAKTEEQLKNINSIWPEFKHPFTLNHHPEEEREELMTSDNDTPCVLLDTEGRCLLYDYRPLTCRLHGLPLIDVSGEVMEGEWCTKNFTEYDPLLKENLRGPFKKLLSEETALGRYFTKELLGKTVYELDTFISTALLIDFKGIDWRRWLAENY